MGILISLHLPGSAKPQNPSPPINLNPERPTILPDHGEERNQRLEPARRESLAEDLTGIMVDDSYPRPEAVCEKWCSRCSKWIEVRGLLGTLDFVKAHRHS